MRLLGSTLLVLLALATLGCTPLKLNACTQIPKIVEDVDMLAPYAGKDVCVDAGVGFSFKDPK